MVYCTKLQIIQIIFPIIKRHQHIQGYKWLHFLEYDDFTLFDLYWNYKFTF